MKSKTILTIMIVITIISLSSGLVAAITQDQGTAKALFVSNPEGLPAGQTATVQIFFQNNSPDTLIITDISLHFDWMPSGTFLGSHLPESVTIVSGSDKIFQEMQIKLPTNITSGMHTYTIWIDGTENGATFSWNSPEAYVEVTGGTGTSTTTPTNTNTGGSQPLDQSLLLIVVVVVLAIVAVLLIVVLIMRRRKAAPTETPPATAPPETTSPSPEPTSSPEQNAAP